MQLLENPGRKLKSVAQLVFILGIFIIAIAAVLCIALVSQSYYEPSGLEFSL